ncbi:MAG TPA: ComEC/Rec2 family competence protein, partial [Firmicutes bacterium]|nr:ComEC/Rec2 family competence protein [Bacillota bacterium]
IAKPNPNPIVPWIEISAFMLILIPVITLPLSLRIKRYALTVASFFLGLVWITVLPTWQTPLRIDGMDKDGVCSVIGRAANDAIETPIGRFFPLKMESIRPVSSEGESEWRKVSGIAMIKVRRDFHGLPGARYLVSGIPVTEPEQLYQPVIQRYRTCLLIVPDESGYFIHQTGRPNSADELINVFRYRLMSHLSWGLGESEGELVAGITFGRRGRRIEGEWAGDFYRAGLSHLIVASGAQVSLLFMPVFFILARIRMYRHVKTPALILLGVALMGFSKLLGGEPSILRAAAMGCILLIALGFRRRTFGLTTLCAAAWFWLMQNPLLVQDLNFLLSMGASFGIIYFGSPASEAGSVSRVRNRLGRIPGFFDPFEFIIHWSRKIYEFLVDCAHVTFSAQVGVMPVLASTMGKVPVIGIVANLIAVPIGQIILFLGALSGAVGFFCPTASVLINKINVAPVTALMMLAKFFADLPGANTPIEPLPSWIAVGYFAVCIFIIERMKSHTSFRNIRTPVPNSRIRSEGTLIDIRDEIGDELN